MRRTYGNRYDCVCVTIVILCYMCNPERGGACLHDPVNGWGVESRGMDTAYTCCSTGPWSSYPAVVVDMLRLHTHAKSNMHWSCACACVQACMCVCVCVRARVCASCARSEAVRTNTFASNRCGNGACGLNIRLKWAEERKQNNTRLLCATAICAHCQFTLVSLDFICTCVQEEL